MSATYTLTETFNVTHARKLAAKVIADMHQCNLLYKRGPGDSTIKDYEQELVAKLAGGYITSYEFGFQDSTGKRVLSWKYTVGPSGDLEGGRSGGLYAQANLIGTLLFNFMTTNTKWASLTATEKAKVNSQHDISRVEGSPPSDGSGYWSNTRSYAAGGVAVNRQEFRPL
jgi:Bacterial HORMA domain family 1